MAGASGGAARSWAAPWATTARPARGRPIRERALTAERPRTRYTVGSDAKLLGPLSRLLPDRAKDAIFGRLTAAAIPNTVSDTFNGKV